MTSPARPVGDLSAGGIQHQMLEALAVLRQCTRETQSTARAAAKAEADYRRAHAQAQLRSDARSADLRNAEADDDSYDLMLARNVARADAESCRVNASNVRAALSALQSLLSSSRAEDTHMPTQAPLRSVR